MPGPTPLVRDAVNRLLDRWADVRAFPHRLPAEAELAAELGLSRTPLRAALAVLGKRGVVRREDDGLWLRRAPQAGDRYRAAAAPVSKALTVEAAFYDRLTRRILKPGDRFTELELARDLGTTTAPVREALLRVSRYGLVRKDPRRSWEVVRLDAAMVDELFDLREALEGLALERALALPPADPAWAAFAGLLAEHRAMAGEREPDGEGFAELDGRFHRALIAAAGNRYVADMLDVLGMTIHFQLRDAAVGAEGMACGLREHPAILEALLARDEPRARRALRTHLASARRIMRLAAGTSP